jgi:hypothetical protein
LDGNPDSALGTAVIAERCNALMPAMRNASATSLDNRLDVWSPTLQRGALLLSEVERLGDGCLAKIGGAFSTCAAKAS